MKTSNRISRRNFLLSSAAVGGGLALGFTLPASKAQAAAAAGPKRVNIWVEVAPDDSVTIKYARSEMGQGSLTSAPQIVADELDANWEQVHIAYVDVHEHILMNKAWGSMQTVGSQTIRNSQSYLRQAGATARAMLVAAAAQTWKVPASEITVKNGIVAHAASKKQSGFGALAALAATQAVPKDVPLKDPATWNIIGQSKPRVDIPASVNGTQVYGIDVSLPTPWTENGRRYVAHASGAQRTYFLTFKGNFATSRPFGDVRTRAAAALHDPLRGVVVVDSAGDAGKAFDYEQLMFDTVFALILRGDQPYSYRYTEAVCSGAVPVMVLSGGWVPPFSSLAPFSSYGVEVAEDDLPGLVARLRSMTDVQVEALRGAAHDFCMRYLVTVHHQTDALIQAALLTAAR